MSEKEIEKKKRKLEILKLEDEIADLEEEVEEEPEASLAERKKQAFELARTVTEEHESEIEETSEESTS